MESQDPRLAHIATQRHWPSDTDSPCDVYVIRHGFSKFNAAEYCAESEAEVQAVISDEQFLDCDLHAIGYAQARSLHAHAHTPRVRIVFVSPLRRALETAHAIFENAPFKNELKFVVVPHLTESLCNADDVMQGTPRERATQYSAKNGIQHDFSLFEDLDDGLWYVRQLTDARVREDLLRAHDEIYGAPQGADEASAARQWNQYLIKRMHDAYPHKLEAWRDIYARVQRAKGVIADTLRKEGLLGARAACVVAHHETLICFTARGLKDEKYDEQDHSQAFEEGYYNMQNCEVLPYSFE